MHELAYSIYCTVCLIYSSIFHLTFNCFIPHSISLFLYLIFSSNSDGYGSFVRPHKLNLGIDIIDAIQKRYASFSDDDKEEDLYLFGTGHQKVVIEAVGFDKVQEKQRYNPQFCSVNFDFASLQNFEYCADLSLRDIFMKE